MYRFDVRGGAKSELYQDLAGARDAVTAEEPDGIANMANAAALIWQYLPDLNWAGFYRAQGETLVLGPFQGKAACIRIAFGAGVCGAAAATRRTQCIADVHAFPGHIACDADSAAELVVPIVHEGVLLAVLISTAGATGAALAAIGGAGVVRVALAVAARRLLRERAPR